MRITILSGLFAVAMAGQVYADFVGVSWLNGVYRINEQTGTAIKINSGVNFMNSLAGPYQGKLYTIAANRLISLDPATGAVLSSITLPVTDFRAAAFSSSGELYATHTITPGIGGHVFASELMTIDIQTGNLKSLHVFDLAIGAMTFSKDGTLYAWDIGASGLGDGHGLIKVAVDGSGFIDVNPAIGTPGAEIQAIEFAPNGMLFGARNRLFTINLATGAWTPVGNQFFSWDIRGLAYVPEPSTILLAVVAIAALPTRRRKSTTHNRV